MLRSYARRTEPGIFSPGVHFAPPALVFVANQQPNLEVPAGFLLEPKAPRRLNIAFQDRLLRDEILNTLTPLREKWFNELRDSGLLRPPTVAPNNVDRRAELDDLYERFSKQPDFVTVWATLQRMCYWLAGEYSAVARFQATEPEQVFEFRFRFRLSQSESDHLHANAIPMLRMNVGLPEASLFFAYPRLQVEQDSGNQ
jgi:hypothetical protein